MNLDEYQIKATATAIYPADQAIQYLTLGLVSEAGEVAGKLKKIIRDRNGVIGVYEKGVIADELGDVLWYIACLAVELNITMSTIAENNISKLQDRQSRGVIGGSGDKR